MFNKCTFSSKVHQYYKSIITLPEVQGILMCTPTRCEYTVWGCGLPWPAAGGSRGSLWGGQGRSRQPGAGQLGAAPGLSIRHLSGDGDKTGHGPTAGQGRAAGCWRAALLHWGRGWAPRGWHSILFWGQDEGRPGEGQAVAVSPGGTLGEPRVQLQKQEQFTDRDFIPENSYGFLAGVTRALEITSAEMQASSFQKRNTYWSERAMKMLSFVWLGRGDQYKCPESLLMYSECNFCPLKKPVSIITILWQGKHCIWKSIGYGHTVLPGSSLPC